MNRTIAPAILLSLTLLLATAAASHDGCEMTTSDPEVDTGNFAHTGVGVDEYVGRWYVDNDPCQTECLFSIWIYPESNGEDGLQRNDEVKDDTCGGEYDGDSWGPF